MLKVSQRSSISPFFAMEMAALAEQEDAAGHDVVHLEVGQPSGGAPRGAREAAAAALAQHNLGYTTALGLPELRTRIAAHYGDWYGLEVDPARVLIVAGASAGFTLAFLSCFDPGDRVGVTEPGYPCYRNTLEALGITPVGIAVGPATGYRLTKELIEETIERSGPLDGLVIASPSNPTGTVLSAGDLDAIGRTCTDRSIRLIADEIYHGLTFDAPASSVLRSHPDAVVLNSFSKYFGMTGWRLGWIVAPPDLLAPMERFQQNLYICAPHVAQVAGLAAFECHDELAPRVEELRRKRDILVEGLRAAGITELAPSDGAFYVYADVSHLSDDSFDLCRQWLREMKVAATPGIDFDPVRGDRFVRFSYAGSERDVKAAVERLGRWAEGRPPA